MDVIHWNQHLYSFFDGHSFDNTVLIAETKGSVRRGDIRKNRCRHHHNISWLRGRSKKKLCVHKPRSTVHHTDFIIRIDA